MADKVILSGICLEVSEKEKGSREEIEKLKAEGKEVPTIKIAMLHQKGNKRLIEIKHINGQAVEGEHLEVVCNAVPWAMENRGRINCGISYTCIEED